MIETRYYVFRVFYNKVAEAEDRPQPKGFDTLDAAKKEYHSFMTQSILSETCGWCLCMIVNDHGKIEVSERWEAPAPVEPEPEEIEENE